MEGSQFVLGGEPWHLLGVDYRPTSQGGRPTLSMFQRELYDPAVIERDLAWMESAGINTLSAIFAPVPPDPIAASIVPKRLIPGTLTLEGIPPEKWVGVRSSPRWWSQRNWGATSYFWCDGKRNLNEIKELMELEAGVPVRNFDMVGYFRFLEEFDIVDFVE